MYETILQMKTVKNDIDSTTSQSPCDGYMKYMLEGINRSPVTNKTEWGIALCWKKKGEIDVIMLIAWARHASLGRLL